MLPISGKTLVGLGLFVLLLALGATFWRCHIGAFFALNSAFLEMVCPAGRLAAWPGVTVHHGVFSGLAKMWMAGFATLATGLLFCWLESPSRQIARSEDFEHRNVSTSLMTVPPASSRTPFGMKRPALLQEAAVGAPSIREPSAQLIDLDEFKAFVVENLRPDRLLHSLREQRARRPGYGYCNIVFRRISSRDADDMGLDDIIEHARTDADISDAVSRVSKYGFHIQIGTYDEPSGRDLQVAITQDDDAELSMRIAEGLD